MINVEVTKQGTENNLGLLRRFSKRMQGSGNLSALRSRRYSQRNISENVKKKRTLKVLKKRENIKEAIKLGKIVPHAKTKGRR